MIARTIGVLAMILALAGCQQQAPSSSVADRAEEALETVERKADAICPKTALRMHEAGIGMREALQSNSAAAIEQAGNAMVAVAEICKMEKENCGTGPARLGMTTKEAIHTSWCFPNKRNTTETAGHIREQWVYPGRGYLYFDNDRLTAI
jgi:PBP1b-binding outer membrane lipoprotein LpoB